jgi:hypothetical protein
MIGDGKNPVEHLLEKTAHRLSQGLTALEQFLARVSDELRAALLRARRFIWQQIRLGLRNLRYLLGLLSIFLALVWIGSGFHELTFRNLWLLKWLGWVGTVFTALVLLGGLLAMFYPLKEHPQKRAMTAPFVLLNVVALTLLVIATHLQYDFRSPILGWTQVLMRSVVEKAATLRNHYYLSRSQSTSPPLHWPWSEKQQTPEVPVPAPVPIPVECKNAGGTNWVPADRWSNQPETPLNMWIERMWLIDGNTILDVAVNGWYPSGAVSLNQAKGTYFVDDIGRVYPLEGDSGDYGFFSGIHAVVGDEIYRFQLTFPGLDHHAKYLRIHHPQFQQHVLEICPGW